MNLSIFSSKRIPYVFICSVVLVFVIQLLIINTPAFWKWAYTYSDNYDFNKGVLFESQLRTMPIDNDPAKIFLIGPSLADEGLDVNYLNDVYKDSGYRFYKLTFQNGSMPFSIFMMKEMLLEKKPYAIVYVDSAGSGSSLPSIYARNQMKFYFTPAIMSYMVRYLGVSETLTYANSFIDSLLGRVFVLYRFRDSWISIISNWLGGKRMLLKQVVERRGSPSIQGIENIGLVTEKTGLRQQNLQERYFRMNRDLFEYFVRDVAGKKVKLVVVEAPIRPEPDKVYSGANASGRYLEHLSGQLRFDYISTGELPQFSRDEFFDAIHLNSKGRNKLSKFIADYLK